MGLSKRSSLGYWYLDTLKGWSNSHSATNSPKELLETDESADELTFLATVEGLGCFWVLAVDGGI